MRLICVFPPRTRDVSSTANFSSKISLKSTSEDTPTFKMSTTIGTVRDAWTEYDKYIKDLEKR